MLKRLNLIALTLFFCFNAYSQNIPVTEKIGKVSAAECAMETFPQDTTAKALVLLTVRACRIPAASYDEYRTFVKAFNKAAASNIVLKRD